MGKGWKGTDGLGMKSGVYLQILCTLSARVRICKHLNRVIAVETSEEGVEVYTSSVLQNEDLRWGGGRAAVCGWE